MEKAFKIGLVGSTNTGKTSFVHQLLDKKQQFYKDGDSKFQPINNIYVNILGKKEEISINDVKGDILESKHKKSIQICLRNSKIIVLFFSVDNQQSYLQIRNKWIPFLKNSDLNAERIVLMANKIDLRPLMTYQSIEDLALNNAMRVYYSSLFCSAQLILQKIVWDYYIDIQVQKKINPNSQHIEINKGLFSKIFSSEPSTKQKQNFIKQKLNEMQKQCQKILKKIKEQYNLRLQREYKKLHNQLLKIYQDMTADQVNSQFCIPLKKNSFIDFMNTFKKKCMQRLMNKDSQINRKKDQIQKLQKQKLEQKQNYENIIQQYKKSNMKLQFELQQTNRVKQQLIDIQRNLEQQLTNKNLQCTTIKQQKLLLDQEIQKLNKQLKVKDQYIMESSAQLSRSSMSRLSFDNIPDDIKIFIDCSIVRDLSLEYQSFGCEFIQFITFHYNNYLKQVKHQQENFYGLKSCDRLFEYTSKINLFHNFIDEKSNLLFCIQYGNMNIFVFTPDIYSLNKSKCQNGCILITKGGGKIISYEFLNEKIRLLKYELINLVFGNYEMIIEISNKKCTLCVKNVETSLFKKQPNICQLLQLESFNKKINVNKLQILQLKFQEK